MTEDEKEDVFMNGMKRLAEGPTLRDQFAMAALTGLLSTGSPASTGTYANDAYAMAYAMLEARENTSSGPVTSTPVEDADVPSATGLLGK